MRVRNCFALPRGCELLCWAILFAVVLGTVQANAQPQGRRGSQLEPDAAEAAWALQAEHAAGKLDLDAEATGKLVKAYQAARTAFAASLESKMAAVGETEDRSARREAYRAAYTEAISAERAKFEKDVETFLPEGQSKKAVDLLGSFSTREDLMVDTIAGFSLGEKQAEALELVSAYTAEQSKMRESITGQETDFSAYREKMMAAKSKLDTALESLLSADQLTKWKDATSYRRGSRR